MVILVNAAAVVAVTAGGILLFQNVVAVADDSKYRARQLTTTPPTFGNTTLPTQPAEVAGVRRIAAIPVAQCERCAARQAEVCTPPPAAPAVAWLPAFCYAAALALPPPFLRAGRGSTLS